ncbi:hypothetical protein BKA70DRAFT_1308374 [Coprinopsis sp. MPI-PUGE-AT-0042]|nr:hypothetical protein BKA70DRAFT_1308374 [Coprinopsis sp. MPI-PUGE-AT-0042]
MKNHMAKIVSSYHSPGIPHEPSTDDTMVSEFVIYPNFPTPVQDLPDEVLAHIFWVALPAILDGPARRTLTALRLVCRRWNTIALATPNLWRGVSVRIQPWDRPFGISRHRISDLEGTIGLWLQRGGDKAPCTLHFDHWSFSLLLDQGSVARFLASPKRTWRELSFPIKTEFVSKAKDLLRENGDRGWESLKWLEIYQEHVSFYDIPSVPSVQSLHLVGATGLALEDAETGRPLEPPSTGGLVYQSLTSLHISRCYILDSLAFAKFISPTSFPSLRVLVLDSLEYAYKRDPFDSMLEEPTWPLTCKHEGVEHLTSIGSETAAVLVNLHLPSLKVWRLERVITRKLDTHSLDTANRWYQYFAEHSTDHLHTLDLGDSCMLPSQVAALLEKIPSVKKLYVQDLQPFQYLVNSSGLVLAEIEEIAAANPLLGNQVVDGAGVSQSILGNIEGAGIQAAGDIELSSRVVKSTIG